MAKTKNERLNMLQTIMEEKGTPSLKAIAAVFDLPPVRLYTVAKQPKEGVVYDAKVYNWDAIERFIVRRLGQDGMPETLEEVVIRALEEDVKLKEADGRRRENRGASAYGKKIEVDGKMVAARRFPNHEMLDAEGHPTNNLVVLKKDPSVYKIVYQTASHTVLAPVSDAAGTIASQDVKCISNGMLNMKGMNAVANAQGVEMRFSGEYLQKFPQYAPGYVEPEEAAEVEA